MLQHCSDKQWYCRFGFFLYGCFSPYPFCQFSVNASMAVTPCKFHGEGGKTYDHFPLFVLKDSPVLCMLCKNYRDYLSEGGVDFCKSFTSFLDLIIRILFFF